MTGFPAVSIRSIGIALAALALLAGSGCSSSSDKKRPPLCPRVAVLSDAAALTRFVVGAGQDLVDVDYQVEVTDILSGCKYVTTEGKEPVIVVAMAPVLIVLRGPANRDREAHFEYFVSVIDAERTVLNKQIFSVSVKFPGNRTRVTLRDNDPPVAVDIPLAKGRAATDYQVLIGFQLSPDELEYNRRIQNNRR